MKDIGERIKTEIEDKLTGIIADEELSAIIDASLPEIREKLQYYVESELEKLVRQKLGEKIKELMKEGPRQEETLNHIADHIRDQITKSLSKEWLKESESHTRYGQDDKPAKAAKKYLERCLVERIERKVANWGVDKEMNELSNKIIETLVPKSASYFLEQVAMSVLSGKVLNFGLSPGEKRCPECNAVRTSGDHCCGNTFV